MKKITRKSLLVSSLIALTVLAMAFALTGCLGDGQKSQGIVGNISTQQEPEVYSSATLVLESEDSPDMAWTNDSTEQKILDLVYTHVENPGENPLKTKYIFSAAMPGTCEITFKYGKTDNYGVIVEEKESMTYKFEVGDNLEIKLTDKTGTMKDIPEPVLNIMTQPLSDDFDATANRTY